MMSDERRNRSYKSEQIRHEDDMYKVAQKHKKEVISSISYKPVQEGNNYGVRYVCNCDFPEDDTLTLDMKYCFNCGTKLDWSEYNERENLQKTVRRSTKG